MTTAPNPGGLGRPSMFTAEVRQKVLSALRVGCTRQAAAGFAGISHRTLRSWLAKGASQSTEPTPTEGESEAGNEGETPEVDAFAEFRDEVEAAEALCEARISGALFQAALTDPKTAQWLLERRFPAEWSRAASERRGEEERSRLELGEGSNSGATIDVSRLTDEQLRRISRGESVESVTGITGVVLLPAEDPEGRSRGPTIFIPPESDD